MSHPPYLPRLVRVALGEEFVRRRRHLTRMYAAYERSLAVVPVFKRVRTPTLVLWGRDDALFDARSPAFLRRVMPHAEIRMLDDVGHLPMFEAPVVTARHLAKFLQVAGGCPPAPVPDFP